MINALHNTRRGRVFLLGNGPSLLQQLDLLPELAHAATFACNGWFFWKDAPFVPTHYGITDHRAEEVKAFVWPGIDTQRFLVGYRYWHPNPHPAFTFVQKAWEGKIISAGFKGLDTTLPALPTGNCAPLTLAQVAAWLGYQEFIFVGMDGTNGGHVWNPTPDSRVRENGPTRGEWGRRQMLGMLGCFERARRDIEAAGRCIYDATPDGLLSREGVLEYRPLREVLHARAAA